MLSLHLRFATSIHSFPSLQISLPSSPLLLSRLLPSSVPRLSPHPVPRLALLPRAISNKPLDPFEPQVEALEEEKEEDEGDDNRGSGRRGSETYFHMDPEEEYRGSGRRGSEKDYDRDPEFGEILGSFFEDPQKAQARVEDRIKRKGSSVLQKKTGSSKPMNVTFNKFKFSNSYIWFEFYGPLLPSNVSLMCDTIRSWHIIGRLGGCNSLNMQLSQAPLNEKRPIYNATQGANVEPSTFYNIGDFEIQENLARICLSFELYRVDIGMTEPLLLDILINALVNINSDFVGIKQVVFGGNEFMNWKENFISEDAGCSVHKI